MTRATANARARKNDAEHFLADARKSFQLAVESVSASDIERHAKMGREFLQLAHRAAELKDSSPSLWPEKSSLWSERCMSDRFRLTAAWLLTFALCCVLISTAYWNIHWGIIPLGR